MASEVYTVPASDDLCIVIGDTWEGADLTLSASPGTGTYQGALKTSMGVVQLTASIQQTMPSVIVRIELDKATTATLSPEKSVPWSLLYTDTGSSKDRTICAGSTDIVEFATSAL